MIEIITVSSQFFFGLCSFITANTHYAISKMTLLEYSLTTPHDKKVLFGTLSFWHMVCKSMNFYLVSIQKRPSLTKWWWSYVCSKWRFLWQARLLKWWNWWNSSKNFFLAFLPSKLLCLHFKEVRKKCRDSIYESGSNTLQLR